MTKNGKIIAIVAGVVLVVAVVIVQFSGSFKQLSGMTELFEYKNQLVKCMDAGDDLQTCSDNESINAATNVRIREYYDGCLRYHGNTEDKRQSVQKCLDDLLVSYSGYPPKAGSSAKDCNLELEVLYRCRVSGTDTQGCYDKISDVCKAEVCTTATERYKSCTKQVNNPQVCDRMKVVECL